jgi:predicted nucleic acid-binding protein
MGVMVPRLLLDTDVLVDYLRGREEAAAYLEARPEFLLISAITVAELYAGVREGEERRILAQFLGAFEIIPLDAAIAQQGGLYRRDYGPSHGVRLADALIAATAELHQARLVTLNARHFPMVEVEVPYKNLCRL